MVVPDGGQPIKLDNITAPNTVGSTTSSSTTGSIVLGESQNKIDHPSFSLGYRPKADKISFSRI
jgi:hypothetical protein